MAVTSARTGNSTEAGEAAARILDVAEQLVQQRGFNAVSYADIAAELGITKPAVHYHFPSKAGLGAALVERYRGRFATGLVELDRSGLTPAAALAAYAELYQAVLVRDRMCLCGMLAAEYATLPAPMQRSVLAFFADSETWLAGVLERGRADGSVRLAGTAEHHARVIVSSLEGAMLVARAHDDPRRFQAIADTVLGAFAP